MSKILQCLACLTPYNPLGGKGAGIQPRRSSKMHVYWSPTPSTWQHCSEGTENVAARCFLHEKFLNCLSVLCSYDSKNCKKHANCTLFWQSKKLDGGGCATNAMV